MENNLDYKMVLNESYGKSALHVKKSFDCYIKDENNNIYVDTAMGGGTFILGHSQEFVKKATIKQLQKGTLFTIPNKKVYKLASLLKKTIPNFDRFVFCSTGSEATMRAVRIARAYSNKKKIAIFSGGWHGSHDILLIDDDYLGDESKPNKVLKSNGTLPEMLDNIILLPYNNDEAFNIIKKNKDDLAMVLVEPSQGSNPRSDMKSFLKKLRKVTKENDILLGFDEIITGFRIALGGGQEYYGVKADIATYGKSIGGGLPLAVVGGTKEVMKTIKYGTKQNPSPVFMGGTFSANPLSVTSSITVLKYLIKNEKAVYSTLNESGEYLKESINSLCKKEKVPFRMIGINSMLRFVFTDFKIKSRHNRDTYELEYSKQNDFYKYMLEKGVYIASNRINFLSTKHSKKDLDKIIEAYSYAIKKYKQEVYKK